MTTAPTSALGVALTTAGRRRHHPRGSVLVFEGDPAGDVLLVVAGDVKLERAGADRPQMLELLGPGDWLGEMGVLDGGLRTATATALTPVEVSVVGAATFRDLLTAEPELVAELLAVTSRRLARASQHQIELGTTDSLGRVCGRLVELGERFGRWSVDGVAVRAPISQLDIASWAGMSRESVVKAFSTLRDLGWIRTSGRRITLVDPVALRARSA